MRKINTLLIVLIVLISILITSSVYAVPKLINFQGKLTNPNNIPLEDNDYFMTFRIYTVQSGGTHLWTEVQTVNQIVIWIKMMMERD